MLPRKPHSLLQDLVLQLLSSTCFEDAAAAVLAALLERVDSEIASDDFFFGSQLLCGAVHLRPGDSYQRLFGIQYPSGEAIAGVGYIASANAWRWVSEHRCSVSIDVHRGALRAWTRGEPGAMPDPRENDCLPGQETRARLLDRKATHVQLVPLLLPGGGLAGIIALEANCLASTATDALWENCYQELEALASVAAPYLVALPTLQVSAAEPDEFLPIVGRTTAPLIELLRVFAAQEETVLICGPTGAGKSRLARWCHEHSSRKGQPFEVLDLTSVPEELQLAELFGWKKGAFTGSVSSNPGSVARAGTGTLFIDEIDKLSLKAQAGLLRLLEERRYRPLGDTSARSTPAEARFLVGTNADLKAAVRAGRFREDLFYRINVLPLRVPPLSERIDELPRWANYMLNRRHRESSAPGAVHLTPEAEALLVEVPWPGNLRQLDNMLRRAYALAVPPQGGSSGSLVIQRSHVEQALTFEGGEKESNLIDHLWSAAHAFVREAEQRKNGDAPLSLDLLDVLRGMALWSAYKSLGSRDSAFVLLGLQPLVKNRNHHRALRRELARVREVLEALGSEVDDDLQEVLDAAESARF